MFIQVYKYVYVSWPVFDERVQRKAEGMSMKRKLVIEPVIIRMENVGYSIVGMIDVSVL